MGSLFKKRKVIAWLLLVVTILQASVSLCDRVVYADGENSNDIISNSINLAKGKNISEIDTTKITMEDLQLLGVFLSNFYEPWSTEVVDAEDEASIKKKQKEALVKSCNFDEDIADVLVKSCWEMSKESATPLFLGEITDNDTKAVEDVSLSIDYIKPAKGTKEYGLIGEKNIFKEDNHTKATYYTFLDAFSGLSSHSVTRKAMQDSIKDKQLCLYWMNGDSKVPVFDTKASKNGNMHFTASSLIYGLINDELDYNNGIGSALIDCSIKKFNSDEFKKYRDEAIILNSRLYVDCFGNILVDTGVSKYVLLPACANPYSWSKSKDLSDVGNNINVVNLFCLGEAEEGNIKGSKKDDKLSYSFGMYVEDNSLFNQNYFRGARGKSDFDLDNSWKFLDAGDYENLRKGTVEKIIPFISDKACFPNWNRYVGVTGKKKDGDYAFTDAKSNLITDFIVIDNLNEFEKSSNDYTALKTLKGGIFELDKDTGKCTALTSSKSKFKSKVGSGNLNIPNDASARKYLTGIYCSYVLAYFNDGRDNYPVSYYYAKSQFPAVGSVTIDWSNIKVSEDTMNNEIKSMIYYFLHPKEGVTYVATWFKNKVSGILVKWHEDMVGSSDAANTSGSTKYIGFSGYVTLPTLTDIKWTSWLLDEYNNIVVYLIIIIFVILITYCVVGSMTFQRALIGTLLFGILAFFPPLCINASVNFLNTTCDKIYGDKFTYWAIVQHTSYLSDLKTAIEKSSSSGSSDNYLKFVFDNQDGVDSDNYTRIKLKWLSPKKISVTADVEEELSDLGNGSYLSSMFNGKIRSDLSGEEYLGTDDALYLYRDYADIYMYSTSAYNTDSWYDDKRLDVTEDDLVRSNNVNKPLKYSGSSMSMWNIKSNESISNATEYSTPYWLSKGFLINTGDESYNVTSDSNNKSYNFLLDSRVYGKISGNNKELLSNKDSITGKTLDVGNNFDSSSFGLGSDVFKLTLPKLKEGVSLSKANNHDITSKGVGYFYYGLYTESPFYFFNWNIYDQEKSTEFKELNSSSDSTTRLLDMYTMNNQQYFFNYSKDAGNGYGEMRDFCNMHSLFYYVIPYLKACNQGVDQWSNLYGTFLYDDVRVTYTNGVADMPNFNETDSKGNPKYSDEYIYKWWHNYNVERLFNTYSAWVDLMYDCDYSKSETISIMGDKYLVVDPLNPLSYFQLDKSGNIKSGRMMVFSRTEMKYYGLEMKDLTQVEQKIIKTQDKVYEDLLQLMDYYNLGASVDMNEVLATSAGMLTTFAFNEEFSQNSIFGQSFTLYPQSYELKAFSYDAYLRLILAESTNESLLNTDNSNSLDNGQQKSYYQRVIENSSITTGIGFIILDLLAVYAVPALKLFFLILIFFMSVLMIVSAAVKLEINIVKTAMDSLVLPLAKFLGVSVGMAWIVSLFMSDGNTEVTGRGGLTISLGDPSMVVLVMIILNVAVLVLYYKICKKCFRQAVDFAKAVGTSISGAVVGTIGKATGGLFGGRSVSDSVARGTATGRGRMNRPKVSSMSTFAKGAVAGKIASDVFDEGHSKASGNPQLDAKSVNTDKKISSKKSKYDEKAKVAGDKVSRLSNADKNEAKSVKKTETRARIISDSFTNSASTVDKQRDALRSHSANASVIGKTGDFIKDKHLAVKGSFYKGASSVTSGVGNVKATAKKSIYSTKSKVRNSSVGTKLKMDDRSRLNRAKADREYAHYDTKLNSNKDYRKNYKSRSK